MVGEAHGHKYLFRTGHIFSVDIELSWFESGNIVSGSAPLTQLFRDHFNGVGGAGLAVKVSGAIRDQGVLQILRRLGGYNQTQTVFSGLSCQTEHTRFARHRFDCRNKVLGFINDQQSSDRCVFLSGMLFDPGKQSHGQLIDKLLLVFQGGQPNQIDDRYSGCSLS